MPSFAIEVPGEANPLTENHLIQTLQAASSSNPNQIQTGTKQLQQWEKSKGYYRHLQSAYLDQRLPLEVRYLAVIQLKNGIDKYWRKTAQNAVSKDEKEAIQERLVSGLLNENDNRLALHYALVVAKIARYSYPAVWPSAISSFLDVLRSPSSSPLQSARALLSVLYTIKELATSRIPRIRTSLQTTIDEIVAVVGNTYSRLVQTWTSTMNKEDMERSLLAIKAMRRSIITGYEHPNRAQEVVSFWELTLTHLDSFIQLIKSQGDSLPVDTSILLNKHALQLAKLHHEMAKERPAAYVLLPNSLNVTRSYWNLVKDYGEVFSSKDTVAAVLASAKIGSDGDTDERTFIEKIALKGLSIVRASVKMVHNPALTFKYLSPEDKEEKNKATEIVRREFLNDNFVLDAMETLVSKFFILRATDLREWLEEPDEWEKREECSGEDWEISVRTCAEKLFLDLAINYKNTILPPLLLVFKSVATSDNEDVLTKDSVYTAIGLAAAVIHEQLDFDVFLQNVLVAEVQKSKPGFNILRRRTAILIGQWVTVKISQGFRPLVYQIFQHLLNPEDPLNDQVVRVTAGRQFQNIANDWDFQADQFLPYGETILTRLMQLIREVELTETKMALLNTLSIVVERLDHHVGPFAERVVNLLPPLWEQAQEAEENLMKQSILTILTRLVNALRADSLPLHSMVFPLIKDSVDPQVDSKVHLLEDTLDLWRAVVTQTPDSSASPDLLHLTGHLSTVLQYGTETLRQALEITESYVVLAPSHMLSDDQRFTLIRDLAAVLGGNLNLEANSLVCNLVELLIRSACKIGGEPAVNLITADLIKAELLTKILSSLHSSWVLHCSTTPRARDSRLEPAPVDGPAETDYFAVLARLILGSVNTFCQAVQTCLPNADLESSMNWLLEEWFSHIENVGDPSRRKLMCLALTSLLGTNQPFILVKLQSLMTTWTDVIAELKEGVEDTAGGGGGVGDSLVYNQEMVEANPLESPEDVRLKRLTYEDEVHTINFPQFVQHHLQKAVTTCGGEQQFQQEWLVNVDQDVIKSFSDLGVM